MSKTPQATGKELKTLVDYWTPVHCAKCNKSMGARWAVHGKRKYCADKCKQAAYRDRMR